MAIANEGLEARPRDLPAGNNWEYGNRRNTELRSCDYSTRTTKPVGVLADYVGFLVAEVVQEEWRFADLLVRNTDLLSDSRKIVAVFTHPEDKGSRRITYTGDCESYTEDELKGFVRPEIVVAANGNLSVDVSTPFNQTNFVPHMASAGFNEIGYALYRHTGMGMERTGSEFLVQLGVGLINVRVSPAESIVQNESQILMHRLRRRADRLHEIEKTRARLMAELADLDERRTQFLANYDPDVEDQERKVAEAKARVRTAPRDLF